MEIIIPNLHYLHFLQLDKSSWQHYLNCMILNLHYIFILNLNYLINTIDVPIHDSYNQVDLILIMP